MYKHSCYLNKLGLEDQEESLPTVLERISDLLPHRSVTGNGDLPITWPYLWQNVKVRSPNH
ncbi:hypothetical protein [Nostoc sp. 'Lobaria pulmonaria (5183) cyanobiont']|uniref:hypothetical protein n=1 Tax=Nostoc sp. 'Lobaria pulmonaria (5183) cyanobiont' TaxID=1618022 RepID=UPI002D783D8A|nr:hypothetical protein [Nostoc sp. 'Lobaria pulmonaria (5183) cyanobiont']